MQAHFLPDFLTNNELKPRTWDNDLRNNLNWGSEKKANVSSKRPDTQMFNRVNQGELPK